jgi:hypothetical protein
MNADIRRTNTAQWSNSQRQMLDQFNEFDKEHPEFWDQFKVFTCHSAATGGWVLVRGFFFTTSLLPLEPRYKKGSVYPVNKPFSHES